MSEQASERASEHASEQASERVNTGDPVASIVVVIADGRVIEAYADVPVELYEINTEPIAYDDEPIFEIADPFSGDEVYCGNITEVPVSVNDSMLMSIAEAVEVDYDEYDRYAGSDEQGDSPYTGGTEPVSYVAYDDDKGWEELVESAETPAGAQVGSQGVQDVLDLLELTRDHIKVPAQVPVQVPAQVPPTAAQEIAPMDGAQ